MNSLILLCEKTRQVKSEINVYSKNFENLLYFCTIKIKSELEVLMRFNLMFVLQQVHIYTCHQNNCSANRTATKLIYIPQGQFYSSSYIRLERSRRESLVLWESGMDNIPFTFSRSILLRQCSKVNYFYFYCQGILSFIPSKFLIQYTYYFKLM